MAELLAKIRDLQTLDINVHWFCDRKDDATYHHGSSPTENHKTSALEISITARHELVLDCLHIFAYDSPDIDPQKSFLAQRIDRHLGRCDTCIIEYYKVKRRLMDKLRNEYDDEEVAMFSKIFDERDICRITKGLKVAEKQLLGLPPEQRGKDSVEKSALLAIFEALSCEEFLADDKLIRQHLEEPFKLLQTNVRLQVTRFVPAATVFLFDADQSRCYWAMHTWSRYRSQLTKDDFNFAVRGPLSHVLAIASEAAIDMNFVQRLWCGIRLIVDKLDSSLITHSLRAMKVDVCRLALEHLKYETAGLRFLLQTTEKLLSKTPKDFWDAMGAISPTTFIEQVFNNPQYDRFMAGADKEENYEFSALKDMLFWVQPFMASLLTSHQPGACRSLVFQLLGRLQADRFPQYTRVECYRVGLGVLIWTLSNFSKDRNTLDIVGRVAAAETLNVTSIYITDIISIPSLPSTSEKYRVLMEPSLMVITTALMLECKSLRSDQEALQSEAILPHGYSSFSLDIWQAVVRSLDRGNVVLAKAALAGISDLAGLEKFIVKEQTKNAKEKTDFNMVFGQLTHWVCAMLERINDFTPQDLDKLFRAPETAIALVSSLFSADASTYEAGVNLIKAISGEVARKEAISHLLLPFFETTLNSFSWSVRRIAHKRAFASCPRMLKTCTDVLDILTDAQDGFLRLRPLSGIAEIKAVEHFWEHMWEALRVIYEMTEEWSRRTSDSIAMKNFCRDTMQFSDHLFDQYSIFSNAVDSASSVKQDSSESHSNGDDHIARRDLLKHPSGTMEAMVRWLRLRDEYLASTFEALIMKVLHRLSEWKLTLPEPAITFLEQVIAAQARTILTPQQKAGLARSLEANLGRPVTAAVVDHSDRSRSHSAHSNTRDSRSHLDSTDKQKPKSGTIDLGQWAAKVQKGREIIDVSNDDKFGDSELLDEDILAASSSVERFKKLQVVKSSSVKHMLSSSSGFPASGQIRDQALKTDIQKHAAQLAFREKREKEIQAKKKRDAEALAKAKKNISQHGNAIQLQGESSNVGKLGVLGKDHAPKGSGMMVSSGSDTDSNDELDHELFGKSAKAPKVSTAVQEYNSSRTQQSKAQVPVKKTRQMRTPKDMRARLAPDLSALHKTILNWDFFHNGDFPPNTDRDNYSLVTSTFRNPFEYQTTFEPLLILEAWQAVLKSKEEGYFKSFNIKVANRLTVDAFVEVSTSMDMADGKALGISEADIILMSKASSPASDSNQPHCLARVFRITRKQKAMEISYRVNVGNNLMSSIVPDANLYGVKVSSITPLEREYGALLGLKYYDLCDEIVKARASPLLNYSEKQVESIISIYKLNSGQAKAVKSAIDNDAFTLIQGPPGSGKTKTIVAIVGALLTTALRDAGGVKITRPTPMNGNGRPQPSISTLKKLLVCAPSNAAVDELVMRLKGGVKSLTGEFHKLSVVRLGRSDNINANVLDVTLDELVNVKLNLASGKKTSTGDNVGKLMINHKSVCEELNTFLKQLDALRSKGQGQTPEQSQKVEQLKRKKQELSHSIDLSRDNGHTAARDAEINRRQAQQEILDGAHVLCATLSGSGHDMFQNLNIEFETVIIDEAAQSIELSALIPLKYGCAKCVMVGDPKQLPPTVLSREAARFQYEQSLFVRMQRNHPDDIHLLDIQYRMHPEISRFPSQAFYDGKLLDGPNMAKTRTRPWHESSILGPYRYFDVQGAHQSALKGHSLINVAELEVALQLFDRLITDYKCYDFTGKVGIITPYKSQLAELRARFVRKYGDDIFKTIDFNTTDAFQGRESEVIIFSCVRASAGRGIGFLSDIRRMNVGITRAKSSLWVLGNSQSLMQSEFWASLIDDAKRRNRYTQGNLLEILRKPGLLPGAMVQAAMASESDSRSGSHNIVMLDAPIPGQLAVLDSTPSHLPVDAQVFSPAQAQDFRTRSSNALHSHGPGSVAYSPSGGNGFNTNAMCDWCGSYRHLTMNCDNSEALKVRGWCYRCHSPDHNVAFCTTERCVKCGLFGHQAAVCPKTEILSSSENDCLIRAEAAHQRTLRRAPELHRKRQMGDHDRAVPIVKTTRQTLAAAIQGPDRKRKRVSSPPLHAPKSPRNAHYDSGGGRNGDALTQAQPLPSQPSHVNIAQSQSRPPPPSHVGAKSYGRDVRPLQEIAMTAIPANKTENVEASKVYGPSRPFAAPHSSGGLPPQIRKKKEVDPFIKPKARPRSCRARRSSVEDAAAVAHLPHCRSGLSAIPNGPFRMAPVTNWILNRLSTLMLRTTQIVLLYAPCFPYKILV